MSIKAIAQVCGCSLEQVTHFLTKMRETAFQLCLVKKKVIELNLSIGHLSISPTQLVEFKTSYNCFGMERRRSLSTSNIVIAEPAAS